MINYSAQSVNSLKTKSHAIYVLIVHDVIEAQLRVIEDVCCVLRFLHAQCSVRGG